MRLSAGALRRSSARWQFVFVFWAACAFTTSPAAFALVQSNKQAHSPLIRVCGTPTPGKAAAVAVQLEMNATMKEVAGTTDPTLYNYRVAIQREDGGDSEARRGASAAPAADITIPVHFHVLRSGKTFKEGNVPDSVIATQIKVLNKAYAQTGAQFKLASVTRTTNTSWFFVTQGGNAWNDMTTVLHKGDASELNLYSHNLDFPLLGWAQFPWWYGDTPLQDGVFVDFEVLPGGPLPDFNVGNTVVHETGHWLGLFHPFQGGCSDPGDYVADTSPISSPEYFCVDAPKNSCPGAGADPFRNYMDYPPDRCMNKFTTGQATRVAVSYKTYRSGGKAYSPGAAPKDTPVPTLKSKPKPKKKPTVKATKKPKRKPTPKPTTKKPGKASPKTKAPQKPKPKTPQQPKSKTSKKPKTTRAPQQKPKPKL